MNILINEEYNNLPTLYWIPKNHKNPYRERYIACFSTCSKKIITLSTINILSTVKDYNRTVTKSIHQSKHFTFLHYHSS